MKARQITLLSSSDFIIQCLLVFPLGSNPVWSGLCTRGIGQNGVRHHDAGYGILLVSLGFGEFPWTFWPFQPFHRSHDRLPSITQTGLGLGLRLGFRLTGMPALL